MSDYLVRVLTQEAHVRGLACVTTDLVQEACRRHATSPVASAALGRALTGGVLMGALLKSRERVALKFEGNGPMKKVLVEADSNGAVRGTVGVPDVDVPLKDGKLDVAGALGRAGFLTVIKDLHLKEPYQGVVQLYTSQIGSDIAYYLTESEQIPSAVGVGVYVEPDGTVSAAGGFLVQSLPPSDESMIDRIIRQIGSLPSVTDLLRAGTTPEALLGWILAGIPHDVLERRVVAFRCSCSRERMEQALISLGPSELESIIETEEVVDITCEFCRERYAFGREELERLTAVIH